MPKTLYDRTGSALIMSVGLTALIITASLSISVAIAAVARSTSQLAAANQSFFAAEGVIEEGVYKVTQSEPGQAITLAAFSPGNGSDTTATSVDNRLIRDESDSFTLAPQQNLAIYLYNYDTEGNLHSIPLNDFSLSLSTGDDLESIKSDFSLENGTVTSFDEKLGKVLVASTITLRSEVGGDWPADSFCSSDNPLYQQVDNNSWCPVCPSEKWTVVADENCHAAENLSTENVTNLASTDYPIESGSGITITGQTEPIYLDFSVYGQDASFYLDQDENNLVSAGSTAKFTILTTPAGDTNSYYRELETGKYDLGSFTLDENTPPNNFMFRKTNDSVPDTSYDLTGILAQDKPTLLLSNYNLTQTLTLTYTGDTYIPSPEIAIEVTGQKGEASQKIAAQMVYRDQVPVFQQSVIY